MTPGGDSFSRYRHPREMPALAKAGAATRRWVGDDITTIYRARGRRIVNSLYSPTRLLTVMAPPCCCVTMS